MSDEIQLEGLGIAAGVVEQICAMAAEGVDGVAAVCPGQSLSARAAKAVNKQGAGCVAVSMADGAVAVALHVDVEYGTSINEVAEEVKTTVADAIKSQVGAEVASVDVFVDGVVFAE
jgi:uncharacterized alkaline shock family protein YloU